ncbi:MAG TPA: hydrogenase maturation nickel metallochaperone HypA [Candidatus Dormibacteraeota bacterium]|jgi:hydrogenase nickel incorporation protein HypA/HybF|nr:hydrogenase maturation nickel metallochaperone HypA [Candidatus Dormibacteraeota bacterium]
MHEIGLCEGVLGVVLEAADGRAVRRVRVRVGRLLRVWPESFEQAWRLVGEATPAGAAAVELDEVPARIRCRGCGHEAEPGDLPLCPGCGSSDVEVVAGDELIVEEVELEGGTLLRNPTLERSKPKEE